jgi:hypothetical protein
MQKFEAIKLAKEYEHHKGTVKKAEQENSKWHIDIEMPNGEQHEIYIDGNGQLVRMVKP